MIETFVNDLVSALASSGSEALTGAATTAIGKVIAGLRERFRKDPRARGALAIVVDDAGDAQARNDLATLLDQRVRHDAEFSAWLRTEWGLLQPVLRQVDASVANTVTGDVSGSVIQARNIDGGVHIGAPLQTPDDQRKN